MITIENLYKEPVHLKLGKLHVQYTHPITDLIGGGGRKGWRCYTHKSYICKIIDTCTCLRVNVFEVETRKRNIFEVDWILFFLF